MDSLLSSKNEDETDLTLERTKIDQLFIQQETVTYKSQGFIEKYIREVGNQGRYQVRLIFFLSMHWMFSSLVIMGQPLFFLPPEFRCPRNNESSFYPCKEEDGGCQSQNIDPESPITVSSEFNLYCSNNQKRYQVGTVFFMCSAVLTLFLSYLTDVKGRKFAMILSYSLGSLFAILSSFANSLNMFLALYVISGAGFMAYVVISNILITEVCSSKMGVYGTVTLLSFWALGQIVILLALKFLANWRLILLFVVGLPSITYFATFFFIYESPRFLFRKGQVEKAQKVLLKMSQINLKQVIAPDFSFSQQSSKVQYNFYHLFRYPSLRKITFCTCYVYFAVCYCYYVATLGLPDLGGDLYVNGFFLAFSELLAYLSAIPLLRKVKRKTSLIASFSLIALPWTFLKIPEDCENNNKRCSEKSYHIACSVILKYLLGLNNTIMYVYSTELYPTSVRGIGCGAVAFFGYIAAGLGSGPTGLLGFNSHNPMLVIFVVSFLGIIASAFLNETFSRDLEEEVKEIKRRASLINSKVTGEKIEEYDHGIEEPKGPLEGEERPDVQKDNENYMVWNEKKEI